MSHLPFPLRPLRPLRCDGSHPLQWFRGGDVFVVLFLALLIRGGVLLSMPNALETDPDGYRRLAENLVEHGTFGIDQTPTAYRPPLYPLLLSGCVACEHTLAAIGLMHVALGVATVGLVLVLGRWWGLGNGGAALAAMLVACDPILLNQSTQIMTETPAAFLATLGLTALTWASRRPTAGRWMSAGAVLALGALCRPTLLVWALAAGVVLCLQSRLGRQLNCRPRSTHRCLAAFALGAMVVLSPWAVRNRLQFGRPIVATTHGGFTLLLANNPDFYRWLREGQWGDVWRADSFNADWQRRRPHDELAADRLAYTEAWQNIGREPGTFAYACLVRLGRFWSPLPHRLTADESPSRRISRYAVAAWYSVEFLLALAGLAAASARRRTRLTENNERGTPHDESSKRIPPSALRPPPSPSRLWGLLLVACLTAVHAIFWTDMRMRAAAMPVVALAAAAGATGLKQKSQFNKPRTTPTSGGDPQTATEPRTAP